MKKRILTLLTTLLLTAPYSYAYKLDRISVHDPSVVWEPSTGYYYIFGSHLGAARTKNLTSWTSVKWIWGCMNESGNVVSVGNEAAFRNCQTKTVVKGGEEVEFPAFDAYEWSAAYGDYSIGGNMWAPDVIYNEAMGKWCMYMSINGPKWNSSIVLLTSDKITGPYLYQGPVVVSGFNVSGCPAALDYKNTDLELAIGKQTSLPSRYTAYWGRRWPHCIDPCVFYDEQGRLWMSYGSWSGGIWMLELNKETGLRNYDARYPSTNGNTDGVTSDPYFGRKIAGGFYSSGEGSYIEHIGSYYFLFISNGGLAAGGNADDYNNGGYQMREESHRPLRRCLRQERHTDRLRTELRPQQQHTGREHFRSLRQLGRHAGKRRRALARPQLHHCRSRRTHLPRLSHSLPEQRRVAPGARAPSVPEQRRMARGCTV